MKFASALALPALFLGAFAAPIERRETVDVSSVTKLFTGLLADILPVTGAINSTSLTSPTASTDVGGKIAVITKLFAEVVAEAEGILNVGDVVPSTTKTSGDVNKIDAAKTSGDVTKIDAAKDILGAADKSIKSRQAIVDVSNLVHLDNAIALVFAEISGVLKSVTNVVAIPTDVLTTLGSTIKSLVTVLKVVDDITPILDNVLPDDILSLLGLHL